MEMVLESIKNKELTTTNDIIIALEKLVTQLKRITETHINDETTVREETTKEIIRAGNIRVVNMSLINWKNSLRN
jgi:hypothetical protein